MKRIATMFSVILIVVLIATFAITTESKTAAAEAGPQQSQTAAVMEQGEVGPLGVLITKVADIGGIGIDKRIPDDLVSALNCNTAPRDVGCSLFDTCREYGDPPLGPCVACMVWASGKCAGWPCNWNQQQVVECIQGVLDCCGFDPQCIGPESCS